MKTIITKYPGRCSLCGDVVKRGESVLFFGSGDIRHHDCQAAKVAPPEDEDAACDENDWPPSQAQLKADRRVAETQGIDVFRFSSGQTATRNRRGRCEDAPCCGCCTF